MNFRLSTLIAIACCFVPLCSSFVERSTIAQSPTQIGSRSSKIRRGFGVLKAEINDDNDEQQGGILKSRRREFFRNVVIGLVAASSTNSPANAAMKSDQTVFKAGQELTVDEAKARFQEGQASLDYLLKNYDEISEGGGDNIRRYLGTVGTSSGLYGIAKVMKVLQSEADDIVEYTEVMNEVNSALVGADGSAYMAIFTESSTSGVPPKKYFDDAKIEVKRAIASMQEIAKQLNIK